MRVRFPFPAPTPHPELVFAISPHREPVEEAEAHSLEPAVEAFLLGKRVAGCTVRTLETYEWWLRRFLAARVEVMPLTVRQFFAGLQAHSPSHQHQAYRTLKTFFRWCIETGVLAEDPLRGFAMRTPKTLPDVPTEDELRAALAACPETIEGVRNRAMLLVLADAGLRAGNYCISWSRTGGPQMLVRPCS